uniref:hypothetical protein n=1 Tax=Brunnivagina elsteri TaxID=1247191 RepID=UPI0035A0CDB1
MPPLLASAVGMQVKEHLESHVDTILRESLRDRAPRSVRGDRKAPPSMTNRFLWVCLHRRSKAGWQNHHNNLFVFVQSPIPLLWELNKIRFGLSPPISKF